MSQRERDRLKVLHELQQKHLTQVAAAARLDLQLDLQLGLGEPVAVKHVESWKV